MTATDRRPLILAELDVLLSISRSESEGAFKARSYESALKLLSALPAIHSESDLPPVGTKGFGKDIRAKVVQMLTTGAPLAIDADTRRRAVALATFQKIYGVGPKKAEELCRAGYTTIAELRAAVAAKTLTLTRNQLVGLRYYEDINSRIPRAEMDEHAALLLSLKPPALQGIIVGSYRRGAADSGDIDMLVTAPGDTAPVALAEFVTRLREAGYVREVLAQGGHKCLAVAALGNKAKPKPKARRLDLLVTPPSEFPFAVFYFTGCDTFNVRVRSHALERGFTLNEHALTRVATNSRVEGILTERDIFTALGLAWREPTERTGPEAVVRVDEQR